MTPRVLILRTAGSNCDGETAHAFELAGGKPCVLHLNRLLEKPALLQDYHGLAIPGGFSYGDDIASGRIFANQLTHHLAEPLRRFVEGGKPIIGICNGFQVLLKTGLLPGPLPSGQPALCTLTHNHSGRFIDRWVHLKVVPSRCIWTANLTDLQLPVAHGEGKFIAGGGPIRKALWENQQVALTYVRPDASPARGEFPFNPNGSIDDIAGICDGTGLVFGLMPHPERHVTQYQHPAWSRVRPANVGGAGLAIFRNAVNWMRSSGRGARAAITNLSS